MYQKLTLSELLLKIEKKEYFKFLKLNHGFWQRLHHLGASHLGASKTSTDKLIQKIEQYVSNQRTNDNIAYEYPPKKSHFFDVSKTPAVVAQTYPEILKLLKIENNNILWGVSPAAHSLGPIHPEAIPLIEKFGPSKRYCGLMWKDFVFNGEILSFFKAIQNLHVVIIGQKHLEKTGIPIKYKFFQAIMPVSKNSTEFQKSLEDYHKQFDGQPVVYLSQISAAGIPILYKLETPNAFILDVGRALDAFVNEEDRPISQWTKYIPHRLQQIYLNKIHLQL